KDGAVRLSDPLTGKIFRELRGGMAQSVAFNHDGRLLITTEWYGGVNIWEVGSGEKLSTVPHELGPGEFGAGFSPDGKYFMTCGLLGTKIWNVVPVSPGEDGRPRFLPREALQPKPGYANSACFSPDSTMIAWVANFLPTGANRISVRNLATGQGHSWSGHVY